MKRFILGVMSFAICLILGQAVMANASVKVYHQRSTALINHPSRLRMLNNSKVKYIRVPRTYTHMRRSHKENQMTAVRGKKVTFRTHFLLPYPGKGRQHWGNPQSIAMSKSGYMYIVYCPKKGRNRGRIVRFDMKRLTQLGVTKEPKLLQSVYVKHHGRYSEKQKKHSTCN